MFTFRSETIQKQYDKFRNIPTDTAFDLSKATTTFSHWVIIPNDFPYDLVAQKHDLLVPKRKITSFMEMTDEELRELRNIKEHLDPHYNCLIENFYEEKSIRDHLHLHLIQWREDLSDRLKQAL